MGSVGWDEIVDELWTVINMIGFADVREATRAVVAGFRLDPWDGQPAGV